MTYKNIKHRNNTLHLGAHKPGSMEYEFSAGLYKNKDKQSSVSILTNNPKDIIKFAKKHGYKIKLSYLKKLQNSNSN